MPQGAPHAPADAKAVVAQSSILTVEACSCGVLHLHFGALSLRFTQESLEAVRQTISEALLQMSANEAACVKATGLFSKAGTLRGEA